MKAPTSWNYCPYRPFNGINPDEIYICRLAPYENYLEIEWIDKRANKNDKYFLSIRKRGTDELPRVLEVSECAFTVDNLECDTDYEFSVTCGKYYSKTRLARTGKVPGVIVNYLHPDDDYYTFSGRCLCSPEIVKLPDGTLVASMDVFKALFPQNLTLLFSSDDMGKSWKYLSELCPCFWGSMFVVGNELYMMGCSTEYGDLLVGKSSDGGKTWSNPTVIARGTGKLLEGGCHKAPCVVTEYNGRIYTSLEYGSWDATKLFASCVVSAPIDADLLAPESWSITPPYYLCANRNPKGDRKMGMIEGNIVEIPGEGLFNILRSAGHKDGHAVVLEINTNDPEAPQIPNFNDSVDSIEDIGDIDFPSHNSKFEIRYDKVSGKWFALGTWNYYNHHVADRRVLSFFRSDDCKKWVKVMDLLDIRDTCKDPSKEGFQYPSFIIDGDDILWLSRTAINEPANFHDSNYTTFHIIKNFRTL